MREAEFRRLMEALEGDALSAEDAEKLSESLCEDADLRVRYIRYMSLRGNLAVLSARLTSNQESSVVRGVSTAPGPSSGHRISLFLAASAAMVSCLFAYWQWTRSRQPSFEKTSFVAVAPPSPRPDSTGVGLLVGQEGWWYCPGLDAEVGDTLAVGQWLRLESGTANIRFHSGVEMKLFSGTLIQLAAADRVLLVHGEVRTRVPENATGFTVSSSAADVIDLGTEFSVSAAGATVDVQVHEGLARVEDAITESSRLVEAGEAVRVDPLRQSMEEIELGNRLQHEGTAPKSHIAYRTRRGTLGNQAYRGKLGQDFIVHQPIVISRLGVFDSESDGLKSALTCEIWRRDTRGTDGDLSDDRGAERLAVLKFATGDTGELVDSNRFLPLLQPLTLVPGHYTVVAYGYNTEEPNGNDHDEGWHRHAKSRDDGHGLMEFVGTSRFEFEQIANGNDAEVADPDTFPSILDRVFADRYSAGTFEYQVSY